MTCAGTHTLRTVFWSLSLKNLRGMEDRKQVVVVASDDQDAVRLKSVLEDSGEFIVSEVLRDISELPEVKPGGDVPGVVLVDPSDIPSSEGGELSSREKEILVCVAKGMLNKEIADKLCLSIYTVITHRKNITRKLGIKTVSGLTLYALLNGLIDMSSVQ
ncbi:MAG: response regulator transcription factor [Bacteroidales bacterium]|nr:response regulator transcription factor [Bacteroidales bacterium]MBP3270580.1 response regulator transcription factor [Bacteroidales bacterium]